MIRSGLAALRTMQFELLADDVTYRHGTSAKAVRAVVGRTLFRSANDCGHWVRTETRDFIIPRGELDADPEAGDTIEFGGSEYEVLAPNGEPVWRWSDPHRTALRVHAKHTGGET